MKAIFKTLITFGVGVCVALLVMWGNGTFVETNVQELMKKLCDAFFVPGVILFGFGVLTFASNGGVFDMINYGFLLFFGLFKRNVSDRRHKDFYEYKKSKEGKKKSFDFLIFGGLLNIALAIVFYIAYYTV